MYDIGGVVVARPVLFVASAGGHLEELYQLRSSLVSRGTPIAWVTFDSAQSRSLLAGEADVTFVKQVRPRGYLGLLRALPVALRVLVRRRPSAVYSTGAAVALAFLPLAFLVGAPAVYIESAARTLAPSRTGRVLSLLPWIQLRTQYRHCVGRRWRFVASVFDGYIAAPTGRSPRPIRRVAVMLGTQEGFPFVSLVQRIQQIVPEGVEILWQVGTDFPPARRPSGARDLISVREVREWVDSADVVVAHAGVGSALTVLQHGRTPVLVPRSASRGEHVDEHQQLIARELARRGLAISVAPDELAWTDLVRSTVTAAHRVRPDTVATRVRPTRRRVARRQQPADAPQAA
jgi:UDP-N-acetylglucosamine--N-acetylmuramyl-(pentapeptide) pyrophosphoryl-undecaprenol N-acetylglucosamine transferase